jgi:ELWxxDGT repeat protein
MLRLWLRRVFKPSSAAAGACRSRRRRPDRPRLEVLEDRTLLSASLVADINTTTAGSHPSGFATLNGAAYFFADDGTHGVELWTSAGGSAQLVKDINPGSGSSALAASPSPVVLNGALYFFADDGTHGPQLWRSDGTPGGTTVAVSGPAPGAVAVVNQVVVANNRVFFADPSTNQLWQTGGPGGTAPVTDLDGSPISSPTGLANVGGTLYFGGTSDAGSGLWTTDGTPGGTSFVQSVGGVISQITDVGGTAYFVVTTASGGSLEDVALWTSNGTGATLVRDFGTVSSPAAPPVSNLTAFNGQLYFAANDGTHGVELWTVDGTGAHLVQDINPGGGSGLSAGAGLTSFAGSLYFVADDGTHGPELWQSNAGGTAPVTDSGGNPIAGGSLLTVANGTLYFAGANADGSGLWKTNGTGSGTVFVSGASPAGSGPGSGTDVNGVLFFAAADSSHGAELWQSDGTGGGTGMVQDINPNPPGSGPQAITDVGGTAFFVADDGVHGAELWKSNGTPGGTTRVTDIPPGPAGGLGLTGTPRLLNVNGTVYFFAYDGNPAHGSVQLWKSNGTSTQLVKGFTPSQPGPFGYLAGLPETLTAANGKVFFVADDGTHGLELWQTDGTPGGTALVPGLNPGPAGSNPGDLTAVDGTLFFTATDGTNTGLWKTNGTGAMFLKAGASNLVSVAGTLYFTVGAELWRTDGSTTTLVKNLGAGSSARLLTNVNGALAFVVDGPGGEALWTSNGTDSGTVALHTFSGLSELTAVGNTLYFINGGAELWKSGLTATSTVLVKAPLTSSTGFFGLTNVNGTLVFAASDSLGQELWTSNAGGVARAQDINPGSASSSPHGFAAVGGGLFFAANDGVHGTELFADVGGGASRPATTTTLGASTTTLAQGQAVIFTATVKPPTGNVDGGLVAFFDGGVALGSAPVSSNGGATLMGFLGLGMHSITAVYSGDSNFRGSGSSPVVVNVVSGLPATNTTLSASAAIVPQGQSVLFTANVMATQGHVDGGRVDFMDGPVDLGTMAVNAQGVATLSVALPTGPHNVVAVYSGDANFSGSQSAPVGVTVNDQAATTTALTVSATNVNQGDSVTFTATASPVPGGNVDGGTINFMEGQVNLGTVDVDGQGVAHLTLALPVGMHSIVAVYSGDAAFAGSSSTSTAVTVNPSNSVDTTTTLSASAGTATEGDSVTFTATVKPPTGNVDGGSVDFQDGTTDLGSVAVDANGVAHLTTRTLATGGHSIVAVYSGHANFRTSTSAPVGVTVNPSSGTTTTTTTLTASPTSVNPGDPVSFTATVKPPTGNVDGGSVDFRDGSTDLGSVAVDANGVAHLTRTLATGGHSIVAVYSGHGNFNGSASAAVGVTVGSSTGPASTVTSLTASPQTVGPSDPVTLTARVTGNVGGTQRPADGGNVMFLDNGMPFANATVDPSTGVATLTTILVPGVHTITAVYQGDANFSGGSSGIAVVTVTQPPVMGDVTPVVQATLTAVPGGGPRSFARALSVVNVSGLSLQGPLFVVVHGLRNGVKLRGAAGFVGRGKKRSPFVMLIPADGVAVQPNESFLMGLRFSGRPNGAWLSVLAGFPSA